MNELYELIDNLKRNLDKDKTIVEIKKEMDILNNDLAFNEILNKYKEYPSDDLKMKLYENKNFKRYKVLENDLNLIILSINSELKKISSKGKCGR